MTSIKEQTVNLISLDKTIPLLSPSMNDRKIIHKLKKSLTISKSMKGLFKCCSLTKYPKNTFQKRELKILETPKAFSNQRDKTSRYLLSKGCELSDIFRKETRPIIKSSICKETTKMYFPLMKSSYKLIEELKNSVDKEKQFKSNGLLIHQMKSEYYIQKMNNENIEL